MRKPDKSLNRLPTHSLRHTCGTLGLRKNLSVGEVEDTLGHKFLEMVAHYLHEDVDPDGIGTMRQVRHELTPEQESKRMREPTKDVREKRRRVTEEKQDRAQVLA